MTHKLLFLFLIFCSGNILAQQATPNKKTPDGTDIDYKATGAPMPGFILKQPDGKLTTNDDVKSKSNLFLMIFNPTCGHCEDMTDLLVQNMSLFKKSKLLMFTAPIQEPYLKNFITAHHTNEYSVIQIGTDSLNITDRLFLYRTLPQINVYDKHRKLIRTFCGDIVIDSLKPYIR